MRLTVKGLEYTYAASTVFEARALKGVDISIEQGEFVGIMGRTGCGKSTLIQLMAGLMRPSAGLVCLDGHDINSRSFDRKSLRRSIGVVFQHPEYQLFESTVEKDVAFALKGLGMSREEKRQAVKEALELLGFDYEAVKDESPLGFSGGEKRRIAIAGVLSAKPDILILDEPIAGLDPLSRDSFLKLLSLLNERGSTIIMVSHNADAIADSCRRLILLDEGKLLRDGETASVFADGDAVERAGICLPQRELLGQLLRKKGLELPPCPDIPCLVCALKAAGREAT